MPKKQALINKIKSQKWFEGVRREANPLVFSLRIRGENKYIKKEYGKKFLQARMLVPKSDGNIRVMGLPQAKIFHSESRKRIIKNPQLLLEKIKEDELVLKKLTALSKKIKGGKDLLEIIELFKRHGYLFLVCFSLGYQLFENKSKVKDKKLSKKAIAKHDQWRNAVAEREDRIWKNIEPFLNIVAKRNKLKLADLYYLEAQEFIKGLKNGFSQRIKDKINKRKDGYLLICLWGSCKIFDYFKRIREVKDFFRDKKIVDLGEIKGMAAYGTKKKIKGRVRIIRDLTTRINFKKKMILVAVQTTPDFIPIIKNFSAIVVDEGGITSHAAIISREFKIPCLIGTKVATKVLKNGDLVEVDTKEAIVKILKKKRRPVKE